MKSCSHHQKMHNIFPSVDAGLRFGEVACALPAPPIPGFDESEYSGDACFARGGSEAGILSALPLPRVGAAPFLARGSERDTVRRDSFRHGRKLRGIALTPKITQPRKLFTLPLTHLFGKLRQLGTQDL